MFSYVRAAAYNPISIFQYLFRREKFTRNGFNLHIVLDRDDVALHEGIKPGIGFGHDQATQRNHAQKVAAVVGDILFRLDVSHQTRELELQFGLKFLGPFENFL